MTKDMLIQAVAICAFLQDIYVYVYVYEYLHVKKMYGYVYMYIYMSCNTLNIQLKRIT